MRASLRSEPPVATVSDSEAFGRSNLVPLYPARRNRWLLLRTLRGTPSDAEILASATEAFGFWFAETRLWGMPEPRVFELNAIARRRTLLADRPAKTRDAIKPAPSVLGDSFASVAVEFLYSGREIEMPWPALDVLGNWVATDAIWVLDVAEVPLG